MPDVANVHTDAILSNISQKFSNAAFVGLQMLPVVQVKKESDKYYKYNSKADRFRVPDTLRAPKTESKQVDWKVTTGTYQCEEHQCIFDKLPAHHQIYLIASCSMLTCNIPVNQDILYQ